MRLPSRTCCYELAVTVAILSGGLNIGLSQGILGPTLPDLAQQTEVSLTTASTLATWKAVTFIIGSLVSGVLLQHVDAYVALTPVLLLQAITTALSGWFNSFLLIAIFQATSNLFATIIITGLPLIIFQLERTRARKVAQVAFLLFNVGKTVVPFIAAPFLSPDTSTSPNFSTTAIPTEPMPSDSPVSATTGPLTTDIHNNVTNRMVSGLKPSQPVTQVGWAYVIVGGFCFLMALLYGGIALANGCKWRAYILSSDEKDEEESKKAREYPPPHSRPRMVLVIALFLLAIFMQSGMETIDNALLVSFVSEYLNLSKMTGLILTSLYQGIKVIICIGLVFIVNRIHPATILLVDISCMVLATCGMIGAVLINSEPFFYVAIVVLATGMSNYYATILSWVQLYYPISGWLSCLISIFFGLSGMGQPPLTTGLLEAIGAVAFPSVLLVSSLFCGVFWIALKFALHEPICPPITHVKSEEVDSEASPLLAAKKTHSQNQVPTENQGYLTHST